MATETLLSVRSIFFSFIKGGLQELRDMLNSWLTWLTVDAALLGALKSIQ